MCLALAQPSCRRLHVETNLTTITCPSRQACAVRPVLHLALDRPGTGALLLGISVSYDSLQMRLARPSRQATRKDPPTHPDAWEECHAADLSPPQERLQVTGESLQRGFGHLQFLQGVFTASCKPPRLPTGSLLAPSSSFGRLRGGFEDSSKAPIARHSPPSTSGQDDERGEHLHQKKEGGIVEEKLSGPLSVELLVPPEQGGIDEAKPPEALISDAKSTRPATRVRRTHIRLRRGLDPRTWLAQNRKPPAREDVQLASLAGQQDTSSSVTPAAATERSPVTVTESKGQGPAESADSARETSKRNEAAGAVPPPHPSGAAGQAGSRGQQYGTGEAEGWRVGPWKLPHLPALPGLDRLSNFPSQLWVMLTPPGHPDKQRLMTVQDFFKYTADEGRRFFEELDRDGDERVTVEDIKIAMRKRNLPDSFAAKFIQSARGNRWWSNSVSWEEFRARVDEREPRMLRAFTAMEVNPAGSLEVAEIKKTLNKMGVSATDADAKAMIKALGAQDDGHVSYGKFRNFLILLPDAQLEDRDPSIAWFEAATIVPFGPPMRKGQTGRMLLQAALAGGIASGTTTLALFPLDTLKTRVQSTAGASIAEVVKSAPKIGLRGLYRGVIPAVSGQFISHGLRTFAYEGTFQGLAALTGGAAELQLQGLASAVGTFLGTCVRIPCEVMKQRLQVGRHTSVLEAAMKATEVEGPRGLFRGTAATLAREVPFYVFGMVGYEQLKKVANGSAFGSRPRELADWEMIALGGVAGALASLLTTPADVMKTRIMTAAAEQSVNAGAILVDIVKTEGVGALFKGALPRMFWIAPLGAMNFAGYELAKRALNRRDEEGVPEDEASLVQPEGR